MFSSHDRDTVVALLMHKWPQAEWKELMTCFAKKERTNKTVYPLLMLIKEMPGM